MQLATCKNNRPWVCTVYYVAEGFDLYWLSEPGRRHSIEIVNNQNVAVTVPAKLNKPVVGVQAGGTADQVHDALQIKRVMEAYTKKYGEGQDFYANFKRGQNKHAMYKFHPTKFVLFDELNFPEDGRQELIIS